MGLESPADQVLLDRERELEAVDRSLSAACRGFGRVVPILGGAGVGKTALLERISELGAGRAMRVLRARAGELEQALPFGVTRQLFEPVVRRLNQEDRRSVMSGAAARTASVVGLTAESGSGDPLGTIHALYWLMTNLSELAPLVLIVDDLHWADAESIRWLTYISTRIRDLPVLVVPAARSSELGSTQLISALSTTGAGDPLELRPLDAGAMASLVETQLGEAAPEAFVLACLAATGGNPFFTRELLRAAAADGIEPTGDSADLVLRLGSPEVARSILIRLARLGDEPASLATAVAVLGADSELRHAAALCEMTVEGALVAWDELVRAEILRPGQPLEFIHPIARNAVYQEIRAGERSRKHRRAAAILAADGAEPAQVALHAAACEPAGDPAVLEWLRAAAGRCLLTGAPEAAGRYLQRALREPPIPELRPRVQFELGQALVGLDPVRAAAAFSEAAAGSDLTLGAEARRWSGQTLALSGRLDVSVTTFDLALESARGEPEAELLLGATRDHYAVFWADDPDRVSRRERLHQLAPTLPGVTPGERRVLAIAALSMAQTAAAPAATCLELANRVRSHLPTWLDADGGLETASGIGNSGIICDDPEGFARHIRSEAQAAQHGWMANVGFARLQMANMHLRRGDLFSAEADARISWEILGQLGVAAPIYHHWSAAALAQVLIARGETAEAAALVERSGVCRRQIQSVMYNWPAVLEGELALALGRTEEGVELLIAAGDWLEQRGFTNPAYIPWRARLAPGLASLGRREEALEVISAAVERATYFGAPWALGMALRAAGTVEQGTRGAELLDEAISVLRAAGCRLEHAHAELEFGALLRRGNQRVKAREHLRLALDLSHRCGAGALARRAEQELAATGSRPRRALLTGVDSLTASERRVAEMAAEGFSNPEIAQALFVSRKTVETHLGHAYQKLDVRSRRELPGALTLVPRADRRPPTRPPGRVS